MFRISASAVLLFFVLLTSAEPQGRPAYLPNPKLTPGATRNVNKDEVCRPRQTSLGDDIPMALKRQVFDRYGLGPNAPPGYNVDHLIPVGLGGSHSVENLWPQPLTGEWTHHQKNRLEHKLRQMVCNGEIDLKTAQQEVAADWCAAYKKYVETSGKGRGQG
ncbi:MAG TPA: HNH endonuclease signature motif containing protein [Blastocatellia bacterium]|nr:HNH endonuclease signature motif containing protein [Blastocatellia bacterium]